jgi:acetoin utilization protein AcuB
VTGIDLLDALLKLTGVDKPSGRLELRLTDRPGELARLTTFLSERQLNILSILTYPEGSENIRTVLRVNTIESRPLANALRNVGFEVIWPPAKSERG